MVQKLAAEQSPDSGCGRQPGGLWDAYIHTRELRATTRAAHLCSRQAPSVMPAVCAAELVPTCCVHSNQVSCELHAGGENIKKEGAQPVSSNSAAPGHQAAARPRSWGRALLVITCVWAPPSGVPSQRKGVLRQASASCTSLNGVCVCAARPSPQSLARGPNWGLSLLDTQSGSSYPSRACSRKPDMHHTQLQVLAGAMSSCHMLTRQCCTHLQASECNAPVDVSISVLGFL